jgi:hypothetical protein
MLETDVFPLLFFYGSFSLVLWFFDDISFLFYVSFRRFVSEPALVEWSKHAYSPQEWEYFKEDEFGPNGKVAIDAPGMTFFFFVSLISFLLSV